MIDSIPHDIPRLILEAKPENGAAGQSEVDDDLLAWLLMEMQTLIARYPFVARTLAAAFVAEGHRFAQTPEGHIWYEALSQSDLIRRGQLIWEAYALDNLLETEPEHLPSIWMDTFAAAANHPDLETMLSMLLVQRVRDGSLRS